MATPLVARKLQAGLDVLSDCVQTCEAFAQCCINDPSMLDCARMCLDCATICQACVTLLARESHFYPALCRICADVCEPARRSARNMTSTTAECARKHVAAAHRSAGAWRPN